MDQNKRTKPYKEGPNNHPSPKEPTSQRAKRNKDWNWAGSRGSPVMLESGKAPRPMDDERCLPSHGRTSTYVEGSKMLKGREKVTMVKQLVDGGGKGFFQVQKVIPDLK